MEATKTYTEHTTYPVDKTVEKKIDLLSLKGLKIKQSPDKTGFVNKIPDIGIESYYVDSTKNGEHNVVMTMLSKSPEMLELLMKTTERLTVDIQEQKAWGLESSKDEELLAEIKSLLKQIID